jgi:hypothetical protein
MLGKEIIVPPARSSASPFPLISRISYPKLYVPIPHPSYEKSVLESFVPLSFIGKILTM